jgi:hypothetical protein
LDVFENGFSWLALGGFFIHSIPSLILIGVILIAWKWELIGGIIFILFGMLYVFRLLINAPFEWYMLSWSLTIMGPPVLVGILFILNHYARKNKIKKRKIKRK